MSDFSFKQFAIQQEGVAMKVGVDGVLLGAWAEGASGAGSILDIGTGTGVIALMMAQRFPTAQVTAVEVHPGACAVARQNVFKSPWSKRLEVVCADIANFSSQSGVEFDAIVSNPPYFTDGFPVSDPDRKTARDTFSLPHTVLANSTAKLLKADGTASYILPVTEGEGFVELMLREQLFLQRQTFVITRAGKKPKRSLLSFGKNKKKLEQTTLTIYDAAGDYTPAYKHLTGAFYLAF